MRATIHIIPGYNVHPNIARRPHTLRPLSPRERHRRLTATIMKQIHVSTAKMPIHHAIQNAIDAGLGDREPRKIIEHVVGDGARRAHRQHHPERRPEREKQHETA